MKVFTFPQKKIARAEFNLNVKMLELKSLDSKISGLVAEVERLKNERVQLEGAVNRTKITVETLKARFSKSEGARLETPIKVKIVLNPERRSGDFSKGWCKAKYSIVEKNH